MKAIVYSAYGSADVLKMIDVDRPTPADDEALIEIPPASLDSYWISN